MKEFFESIENIKKTVAIIATIIAGIGTIIAGIVTIMNFWSLPKQVEKNTQETKEIKKMVCDVALSLLEKENKALTILPFEYKGKTNIDIEIIKQEKAKAMDLQIKRLNYSLEKCQH